MRRCRPTRWLNLTPPLQLSKRVTHEVSITMRAALASLRLPLGNVLSGDSWSTWRTFLIALHGRGTD